MKKFVAILTLCVAAGCVPGGFRRGVGITHQWMVTRQVEYPVGAYNSVKLLEQFPTTMEAWLSFPVGLAGDRQQRLS